MMLAFASPTSSESSLLPIALQCSDTIIIIIGSCKATPPNCQIKLPQNISHINGSYTYTNIIPIRIIIPSLCSDFELVG